MNGAERAAQRLQLEEVAEFNCQPAACKETYRMVVVRKNISVEQGEKALFDRIVYFFYLSNDWLADIQDIVLRANGRCHQEIVLAQLHGGGRALQAPVDNLVSNWAYLVMTALAWNRKAWWALTLPDWPSRGKAKRHAEKRWVLGIEFKTFVNAFVRLPCQIVRMRWGCCCWWSCLRRACKTAMAPSSSGPRRAGCFPAYG